jgi:enamine deaminase RidA (YjgF/YER057c/UK114 family)
VRQKLVNASSIYPSPSGAAHAVRFDDTVYTSLILPKNAEGRVIDHGDVIAQAEMMFGNLRAVLESAGARIEDVARVNLYLDPGACHYLGRVYEVRDRFLKRDACAGTVVPATLPDRGALIAIEAIAHANAERRIVGGTANSHWAAAVRVADKLYVSGQYGRGSPFAEQAKSIYVAFDAIVGESGESWHDVVRIHQFGIRPDLSIDQVRAARAPFLRNEEFLSTSVVCHAAELAGVAWPWQFCVDIEAAIGAKRYASAPGTWANPGGLHAVRVGNTGYFSAQMSRDGNARTLYPDDVDAHTDQCCRNIDAMLRAAAVEWADLVHIRLFCEQRDGVPVARRVVDRWLGGNACARADLVVDFYDPLAKVEIEVTACL